LSEFQKIKANVIFAVAVQITLHTLATVHLFNDLLPDRDLGNSLENRMLLEGVRVGSCPKTSRQFCSTCTLSYGHGTCPKMI
jgi:hypothetical protein